MPTQRYYDMYTKRKLIQSCHWSFYYEVESRKRNKPKVLDFYSQTTQATTLHKKLFSKNTEIYKVKWKGSSAIKSCFPGIPAVDSLEFFRSLPCLCSSHTSYKYPWIRNYNWGTWAAQALTI